MIIVRPQFSVIVKWQGTGEYYSSASHVCHLSGTATGQLFSLGRS